MSCMKKYVFNCWKPLKVTKLQHRDEKLKCECYESRKNLLHGAWLNPKHYNNRQSAGKLRIGETSTTIPPEGRTLQAIGSGSG